MFLPKFQYSSAFGPLQIAQSLTLQKKIDYMDQSLLTMFRQSGTSMNLYKLNFILLRSNKMQQYAGVYLLQNYSTCFGRLSHP
jgi:hypothetical protein